MSQLIWTIVQRHMLLGGVTEFGSIPRASREGSHRRTASGLALR